MAGFTVAPQGMVGQSGVVSSVGSDIDGVAGDVAGIAGGGAPPATAAALDDFASTWPAALCRVATSLTHTSRALRSGASLYCETDGTVAKGAGGGRP